MGICDLLIILPGERAHTGSPQGCPEPHPGSLRVPLEPPPQEGVPTAQHQRALLTAGTQSPVKATQLLVLLCVEAATGARLSHKPLRTSDVLPCATTSSLGKLVTFCAADVTRAGTATPLTVGTPRLVPEPRKGSLVLAGMHWYSPKRFTPVLSFPAWQALTEWLHFSQNKQKMCELQ